ncbi:MAG: prolyl oligopeptidase family serine peptidase [Mariniblastus sp.]|nr:prolyl oligopeptidase family serine peptidase [Mariniblastus sp.]
MPIRYAIFVLASLIVSDLVGQGSLADYQRSKTINRSGKNYEREFNWCSDTHLYYWSDVGSVDSKLILLDVANQTKRVIADRSELIESAKAKRKAFRSSTNPKIELLDFDVVAQKANLRMGGIQWQLDFNLGNQQKFKLSPIDTSSTGGSQERAVARKLSEYRASNQSTKRASMLFENKSQNRVSVYWIETSGQTRFYFEIDAGAKKEISSFAGHRWLIRGKEERVLGVFEVNRTDTVARIDDQTSSKIKVPKRRTPPRSNPGQSPNRVWTASVKDWNIQLKHESGETILLSKTGTEDDPFRRQFIWSPDSKYLVCIQESRPSRREVTIVQSSPNDQLQPKLITYDYYKPGDVIPVRRIRLFDVEARKQVKLNEDLFKNAWSISRLNWSEDSSRFYFLYNQRGHQTMRYVSVEPSSGLVSAAINEETSSFFDYQGKLFLAPVSGTDEAIWMSERDGWNHLYLYDLKSGQVKNQITQGDWVVRKVDQVDQQKRQIWFQAGGVFPDQDPYYLHHCRVDFDGKNFVVLTQGNGVHSISYSPDRSFLIDEYSRVDQPPIYEVRRTSDGKLIESLGKVSWNQASQLSVSARPEPFVAKGRDGETNIYGVIFRPSNFDSSKTYPVIEKIYAGPHSAFVPKSFSSRHGAQSMAELGFIVVQIDGMGTSHRSKKFHDVCWKNLGDSGFPDRIEWIKAAGKKYPELDLEKVGIYGGSAGGQSTLRGMLMHPEFYKVGVADCGCHDNRMDKIWWNELWMGWPMGAHYKDQSNVTQAHRLQGKLMLIVGEIDRNVDPASTMQVVNALVQANKDFDFLIMPNTGHGAAGTPYGRRRMKDFFVRHLLGSEPRWTDESQKSNQ